MNSNSSPPFLAVALETLILASNKKLLGGRALPLGARTLLVAPGITTSNKDAISSKGHRY